MHPRNFGSEKIVRTGQYVRPPLHVYKKPGWNFAFQVPARFGGKSHSYPGLLEIKKQNKNNNNADSDGWIM